MGKGKKSSGCGGSFWFFVISVGVASVGIITGTWHIMLIVAVVIAIIGVILFVLYLVVDRKRQKTLLDTPVSNLTPIQYEQYIASYVQKHGFKNVRATRASGDFGADVLCEDADGHRICIQCKHYNKPVGVKAIQEVIAAKEYYKCDRAWVCASNTYTPAACEMAAKTGVELYTVK